MNDPIETEIYDRLGERWYRANDDPVALLRAEARLRNPWIRDLLFSRFGPKAAVLDVGCGAGFLANDLAREGFRVWGIDTSAESLSIAARHDTTRSVIYRQAEAGSLPYPNARFDALCAMDLLEHVENPEIVVAECARVLRPGGLFMFHTFNRNPLSWLVVIKGVEWLVRNTPPHLHVLRLFIKPAELQRMCERSQLHICEVRGAKPVLASRAFLKMLLTGIVPEDFRFEFGPCRLMGYTGYAQRRPEPPSSLILPR